MYLLAIWQRAYGPCALHVLASRGISRPPNTSAKLERHKLNELLFIDCTRINYRAPYCRTGINDMKNKIIVRELNVLPKNAKVKIQHYNTWCSLSTVLWRRMGRRYSSNHFWLQQCMNMQGPLHVQSTFPLEITPVPIATGGWVGPRTNLNAVTKTKHLHLGSPDRSLTRLFAFINTEQ
jgi:hypothetical protein